MPWAITVWNTGFCGETERTNKLYSLCFQMVCSLPVPFCGSATVRGSGTDDDSILDGSF